MQPSISGRYYFLTGVLLLTCLVLPLCVRGQLGKDNSEQYYKGMVVCAYPDAAQVGLNILKKGGNAVDAAVAVQFALAVTLPEAGNIGGGGSMVYRPAKGMPNTLDFREKAPAGATTNMYLDAAENVIPNMSLPRLVFSHFAARHLLRVIRSLGH